MAQEGYKRKLTAILSADVAGYSRLMGNDEAETVKTLTAYRKIMGELIQQHRGRVIDSPGDNMLAEFGSVVDAVQCAVAAQNEFKSRNAELPENRRMEFRIGVNLGDVIEEENRIYGDGVNIAARLEGLADPGGICISKTAFDHIESKLPLGYEYLGEQTVKNIGKPVEAYKVLMEPRIVAAGAKDKKPSIPVWKRKGVLAGATAVLIVLIGVAVWNYYWHAPKIEPASKEKMAYPLPNKPSIAVLPFTNLSGEKDQEYFCDGLSEGIINGLAKIDRLFVIARNSTFIYKAKSVKVKQVAEDLGVRYVLEGSIQKAGDRVRITAHLIDAMTGHYLFSKRYDRELKDILNLQDEITMKVLTAVQVKLTKGEEALVSAKGTNNLDAYLKVLQARDLKGSTMIKERVEKAIQLLKEAIALDPKYAYAYSILCTAYFDLVVLGGSKSPRDSLRRAVALGKKAVSLDESNPFAHACLAFPYMYLKQVGKAISEAKKGVSLAPNYAVGYFALGAVLKMAGRPKEAIPVFQKCLRLSPVPVHSRVLGMLADSYSELGQFEKAIATYKKQLRIYGLDQLLTHVGLAVTYAKMGRENEARSEGEKVMRIDPGFSLGRFIKSLPYDQSKKDRLAALLRNTGLPDKPPLPLPDKPSIAVLPFVNMSGDPKQEYFSDGITEEIITALSKTPRLFVIARTSSFKYKGKEVDVRTVGRELGVRYVLEGSVRKSEDRVRITAQLVDALKGHHIWAEQYDRDLKDIFAVQDEITMKILAALQLKLAKNTYGLMSVKGTKNLKVYLKYLEATALLVRLNPEDNALARQKIDEAIRMEPSFAPAYSIRAQIAQMDAYFGISPRENLKRAFVLAKKATALDETLASGYFTLGFIYGWQRQHEKAIATIEKGLAFRPSSAVGYFCLGRALDYAGRHEEGLEMLKRANRMDPFPRSHLYMHLGFAYCNLGRYEEAIAALKRAIRIQPNNGGALRGLVASYSLAGREEDALIAAKELLRVNPNFSLKRYEKISPYNEALRARLIGALSKAGLK